MDRGVKMRTRGHVILGILITILPILSALKVGIQQKDLNLARVIVEKRGLRNLQLVPLLPPASDKQNEYTRLLKVHEMFSNGSVEVVIAPEDETLAITSANRQIPYLVTSLVTCDGGNQFCMLPSPADIAKAIGDILHEYKAINVAILYNDDNGAKISHLLSTNKLLTARATRLDTNINDRDVKGQLIKLAYRRKLANFVVLTETTLTRRIMQTARSLAIVGPHYNWVIKNMDFEDFGFSAFSSIFVNVTQISLLPNYDASRGTFYQRDEVTITDSLLILKSIAQSYTGSGDPSSAFILQRIATRTWYGGNSGIQFDENGNRVNYTLGLQVFIKHIPNQAGEWRNSKKIYDKRIRWDAEHASLARQKVSLQNEHAKVVTILESPFTMEKKDIHKLKGNDRYEGFSIDLVTEIGRLLNFEFDLYLVPDGRFGAKNSDGEWDGIIRELLNGNATLSVAPLSINAERERAVDFTKPFKTRGINVLMKKSRPETTYFQFLNPLDSKVWICVLLAIVVFSLLLYFFERVSQHRRKDAVTFNLNESFWFIFGSIAQGSTETTPLTIPGRILTSAWWFFSLILISSYTANLAAFLTVRKINAPISSVSELILQNKIRYGTVKSSGVNNFLKNSKIESFSKMWSQMSEFVPKSMVDNSSAGYAKVREGNYAFLWDSTVNSYMASQDCELIEINPPFDHKGFGIGVPPGVPYQEELTMAILNLSDTGRLAELENKWWSAKSCGVDAGSHAEETPELGLENVAGVFFVLIGGIVFSFIGFAMEHKVKFLHKQIKKQREKNKNSTLHNEYNRHNQDNNELTRYDGFQFTYNSP